MLGHDVIRVAEGMRPSGDRPRPHDDLDVTDPATVERLDHARAPDVVINCAAWTDVDGAEESEHDALARQRPGRRDRRRRGGQGRRQAHLPLDRLRLRRDNAAPYVESDDPDPINAYGATKLAGERADGRWPTGAASSFAPRGSSASTAATSSRRCSGSARTAARCVVVHDQVGSPHLHGPPRGRPAAPGRELGATASTTWPARAAAPGTSSPCEIFRQAEVVTPGDGDDHRHDGAARQAAGQLRPRQPALGADRAAALAARALRLPGAARPRLREETPRKPRSSALQRQPMLDWTQREREEREADGEEITGESELPDRRPQRPETRRTARPPTRVRTRREAARHRRRRLHRLELTCACARATHATRSSGARQAHLRRPAREPRRTAGRPLRVRRGAIEDRDVVARGDRGLRRGRQLRRRVARRPLDRRPGRLRPAPTSIGTVRPARGRPRARRRRYLQVSTDEVYGSIESGSVHRGARRSTPPRPTRRPRRAATCSSAPTSTPTAPRR